MLVFIARAVRIQKLYQVEAQIFLGLEYPLHEIYLAQLTRRKETPELFLDEETSEKKTLA